MELLYFRRQLQNVSNLLVAAQSPFSEALDAKSPLATPVQGTMHDRGRWTFTVRSMWVEAQKEPYLAKVPVFTTTSVCFQSLCISKNLETKTLNVLQKRVQFDAQCLNGGKSHVTLAALVAVPFLGILGAGHVNLKGSNLERNGS